jgi:biopolymer transport protein ExbD
MNASRRIRRMTRNQRAVPKLNLTSLMDVFTILVFFLMYNYSATAETLQQPKQITLPETVVIFVNKEQVLVQGVPVARVADIQAAENAEIGPLSARLAELKQSVIGVSTQAVAESQEITLLADRTIPFGVLKSVLAACTAQGYTKVSLAVIQKAPQSA